MVDGNFREAFNSPTALCQDIKPQVWTCRRCRSPTYADDLQHFPSVLTRRKRLWPSLQCQQHFFNKPQSPITKTLNHSLKSLTYTLKLLSARLNLRMQLHPSPPRVCLMHLMCIHLQPPRASDRWSSGFMDQKASACWPGFSKKKRRRKKRIKATDLRSEWRRDDRTVHIHTLAICIN